MTSEKFCNSKFHTINTIQPVLAEQRFLGRKIVFTNGCFDIVHPGHITVLNKAAHEGDFLIVGLNSDESVKRLKGPTRPINNAVNRTIVLQNLMMVDAIMVFEEDTPLELIKALMPDVLVKGGDYTLQNIVGANEVMYSGGKVVIVPTLAGHSTTAIIEKSK
jgi:D-beta-D-heptose 7-phosphate kinase/D-beta-D-heptose 1-phosphate adenosyltransferase